MPQVLVLILLAGALSSGAITVSKNGVHGHPDVLKHGQAIYKVNN